MDYAVIRVGNKQHRVRDGETLVVDRVRADAGGTFEPDVLLGGDGVKIFATVVAHERGPKIRIGKYRRRTGYKRHNGFRAATTRIEISFGDPKRKRPKREEAPAAETGAVTEALPEGYADLKVGDVAKAAKEWDRKQVEAALAYEQAHGSRKGALSALEAALAEDEQSEEPAVEATVEAPAGEEPEAAATPEEPAATAGDESTATAEEEPAAEEPTTEGAMGDEPESDEPEPVATSEEPE